MKFLVPTIVFLGTSLWGHINGDIPFTGIRPSSSIAQRILSSLQLAGSAYAVGDFLTPTSTNASHVPEIPVLVPNPPINPGNEAPKKPQEEQKSESSETLLLLCETVNSCLLLKLIYAHFEDRDSRITYSRNQTAHIVRLIDQQTEILPVMGTYMLQQLNEKFDLIEGSIQRLQARFEKADPTVQELPVAEDSEI